jgi:salicylate hydroxylase
MSPIRVGIIGAGTSGLVLAIFLKLKGYEPVIYERNEQVAEAGLGIG